jgi:RHS repeat-associated protein
LSHFGSNCRVLVALNARQVFAPVLQCDAMRRRMRPLLWSLSLLPLLSAPHLASGYYDPGVQRWINRDPLGEPGFEATRRPHQLEVGGGANLYRFVGNDPCSGVDRNGLMLYLCSRKSDWGVGNHVYFWNDSPPPGDNQTCNMNASSGRGNPNVPDHSENGPPGGDACQPIPETENSMYADAVWSCCRQTANTGVYKPWGNDCHNKLDDCLTPFGITPPKHPRLGHPRVYPSKGSPPIFSEFPN